MTKFLRPFMWILFVALLGLGCAETTTVSRMDAEEDAVIDLSGKWNDTDSRLVSEEMIGDCLSSPWLYRFEERNQSQPTVIVGNIRNLSHEHISENTFIKDMERAFINSGKVDVVEGGEIRDQIRQERSDQQEFAQEETRKAFQQESGADLMLTGTIDSIVDRVKGTKLVFYQVNLELVDIETNKKVWIGDKKIKKLVEKGRSTY
ncbi:MAG: penicillin-binding protein activator LpoB [Candidatus Cloacimonetes bacterium 4572_55]|nr:MAG: penicillin-binding protein activator LpoB [Candidatus Cloacimonetes bacterium 4572_55]